MPAPKVAGTIRSKNPLKGAVEIIPERLYYAALKCAPPSHNILASTPKRTNLPASMAAAQAAAAEASAPQDPAGHDGTPPKKEKKQIHFFNMDNELVYWNFFLDFGPLNLGQLIRFSNKLNDKLRKFPVVCFYSNTVPAKRANAIFLICAWQILYLQRTPEQAHAGFLPAGANETTSHIRTNNNKNMTSQSTLATAASSSSSSSTARLQEGYSWPPVSESQGAVTIHTLPPWHDASPIACTYDLTVRDCLDGLVQAIRHGFFNLDSFNVEEYEHFEQVENGDLNWLAKGKILAFAGPSYERYVSPEGYCTLSPNDYIPYFKKRNVDLVVRLNKKNYNEEDFTRAGIRHVEHFFLDGSCPSMKILKEVLDSFESVPPGKAFAVHCKAGLGRTGSCIGAYIMKHYRFTAPEVIAWMRMCRPGCVIGPQQHFLQQMQDRMWQEGEAERMQVPRPLTKSSPMMSTPKGKAPQDNDAITGRSGQGESLLAARGRRNNKSDITKAIPMPPMTPDSSNPPAAVLVTPGSAGSAKTKAAPLWSS